MLGAKKTAPQLLLKEIRPENVHRSFGQRFFNLNLNLSGSKVNVSRGIISRDIYIASPTLHK